MRIVIALLMICFIFYGSFTFGFMYGLERIYQYDVQCQGWPGEIPYKIFVKPHYVGPYGVPQYHRTILEQGEDGIWHGRTGQTAWKFKLISCKYEGK